VRVEASGARYIDSTFQSRKGSRPLLGPPMMFRTLADFMIDDPKDLREGTCYFLLLFPDRDLTLPLITTYIYVGKNLKKGRKSSKDRWYFQDPDSYVKYGSVLQIPRGRKHTIFVADKDDVTTMFNLAGLIQALSIIKSKE
jgi:hypothetical protein